MSIDWGSLELSESVRSLVRTEAASMLIDVADSLTKSKAFAGPLIPGPNGNSQIRDAIGHIVESLVEVAMNEVHSAKDLDLIRKELAKLRDRRDWG